MIQHPQEAEKLNISASKKHGGETRIKYDKPYSKSNQKENNSHYKPVHTADLVRPSFIHLESYWIQGQAP